jgi:hypothetical protein
MAVKLSDNLTVHKLNINLGRCHYTNLLSEGTGCCTFKKASFYFSHGGVRSK